MASPGIEAVWVGSGHLREKCGPASAPECLCSFDLARGGAGEVSCVLLPPPPQPRKEAPGTPLGIIRLVLFAEAAAHASSLIRFIIFLTGWMCSSRSRPFGELI